MIRGKRLLSFLLALAMVCGQVPYTPRAMASAGSTSEELSAKIDTFVADALESGNVYVLVDDELVKLLETNDLEVILKAQVQKVGRVAGGPEDSAERLDWSEQRMAVERKARALIKEMFSQSIDQLNLSLMEVLHRYLFNDFERGPTGILLDQIFSYRFNPDEIYRLKKEASWAHEYTNGSLLGLGIFATFALWKGRKVVPELWNQIKAPLKSAWKPAAAAAKREAGEAGSPMSVEEMLELIEKMDLPAAASKIGDETAGSKALGQLSKFRFVSRFPNLLGPEGLRGLALIFGITSATGGANVGLHALRQLIPESTANTEVDFNDLRDNFYDPIAVLRLTCLSHEFVARAQAAKSGPALDLIRDMNGLYTEFELIKRMNPALVEMTRLPSEVKVTAASGEVSFTHLARGKTITETFACPKLKGSVQAPASISLNEVSRDIDTAIPAIKELLKPQAPAPGATP